MKTDNFIRIVNASEHNLRSVTLEIPKNKLIVVTGVSGSGKSSLIFDVLYREAESLYLGSFSSFARQFMGKMKKPDVERIERLSPAIALDQKSVVSNSRSTVGTITGIYDLLRLLFARVGKPPEGGDQFTINRSLFSFNSSEGACQACKGLGVEDRLDPALLIADENKSLREGALVITAPNGYIIYSQVTMDILDKVCRSEGFHTGIPWKDLTPEQQYIVLYGSDKIEIPYGKHPLESRMRWSGITVKPREMGYYKGLIPVMETILQRDRNKNILRFVRTAKCWVCEGKRLNNRALSVKIDGYHIADVAALQLDELKQLLYDFNIEPAERIVADPIITGIAKQVDLLQRLGLAYLSTDRESTTLSGGESQRLRLATLAGIGLSKMICIFDEPSVGLHPHDIGQLIGILREMVDMGNTVIVVEHEEQFIRQADWLIDIGPGPGIHGGEVLYNGPPGRIETMTEDEIRKSRTLSFLHGFEQIEIPAKRHPDSGFLTIEGASAHNLREINVQFMLHALNVVTGVSGAGKSTLTTHTLGSFLKNKLHDAHENVGKYRKIRGFEDIGKLISIDQSPIGRTPRSNPATYTGVFDYIRDLFAKQPESVRRGYDKSRFSFNTAGGRCEKCQGAGYQQVGMHFMGNVEVLCESCEGRRFDDETLEIVYRDKNISEILEMPVSGAITFFKEEPKIVSYLKTIDSLGLGYLTLGQRSSTLSGGEAQRIKLATELAKPKPAHTLYIMDEPTTGLHQADISILLNALQRLIADGHTVILIEHHPGLIASADHIIDLGPGSGRDGGTLVFSGTPEELVDCEGSLTANALREYRRSGIKKPHPRPLPNEGGEYLISRIPHPLIALPPSPPQSGREESYIPHSVSHISLKGVTTNNLQHIDAEIPHNKITVLTGVSGSGKSSLAFNTIFAESQNRFLESFSPYVRNRIGVNEKADFEEVSGLTPAFAVDQGSIGRNPRSTIGTITGIYDLYRLLFSRIGKIDPNPQPPIPNPASSLFSFNHQHGACSYCDGLGFQTVCDPERLITDPEKSLLNGAMDGTKTGKFYGEPSGQYVASLVAVGRKRGIDYSLPWSGLSSEAKNLALNGSGEEMYDISWHYKRGSRTGEHHFNGSWKGLSTLVREEYNRKHADHRGESMNNLMKNAECPVCNGNRLCGEALEYTVHGKHIAEISSLSVSASIDFFSSLLSHTSDPMEVAIAAPLIREIVRKLGFLSGLGLSYLTTDRISSTLSGGESQRIKLAGQLGSGLTGITYVLDEPTIGLHPRDTHNLMKLIRSMQEAGNTIVIVEHDRDVILSADHVIDMGPGAGKNGGKILATGTPEEIMNNPNSVTAPFLYGKKQFPTPVFPMSQIIQKGTGDHSLKPGLIIRNAYANNLKGFDLEIPPAGIICITGVSGSGKSTLLFEVIKTSWDNKKPTGCEFIGGFEHFQRMICVHQRTGFSSPLAIPATFTGIFDHIRTLFAGTGDSVQAGFTRNHFSYMNKEGRCATCEGTGQIRISMDFLSDLKTECEQCHGKRFRNEILYCRYHGKNIADILELTVTEAAMLFESQKNLSEQFQILEKV